MLSQVFRAGCNSKNRMIDRWENSKYLGFSFIGDRCTGFLVDCPQVFGIFTSKSYEKTWIRLTANTHCGQIYASKSMKEEFLVAVLGVTTKCRHFSKLHTNNIVWKVEKYF